MKRLLCLFSLLIGIGYSHVAFAQSTTTVKKEAKKSDSTATQDSKKSGGYAPGGSVNSNGGIAIDESGAPKPKSKSPEKAAPDSGSPASNPSAPKEEKERSSSEKSADLDDASPIAIDDSGTPKVKKAKASTTVTQDGNQPVSDSIKPVPASAAPKIE